MKIPDGVFYLGREYDLPGERLLDKLVTYNPADLTTHGVIVGMTGSGKTGLGVAILEEAALAGIPALIIDPKGDLTNLVLHFPDLGSNDFEPWVNEDQARRAGKTVRQMAEETAQFWKKGLGDWGIAPERIRTLADAVQYSIFTPGSESGLPVNILASLQAPALSWETNKEPLREKIGGTVTALLNLVGIANTDPLTSREHILLSSILEAAWSKAKNLDLAGLILQTQSPPFGKLGVFELEEFFPSKDRQELAMRLNSVLASPSFQAWITGQPLEAGSLLYTPDGKPRHSIFYIAHLSEAERMFFVTLLLSAAETWMRAQQGTGSLRALIYFDEVFGYLPPVANPPSKTVFLRMLKQARAFGVGLLLATQNPVDLDYKALSNAGTWWIGKLQTDQDKQRLLDGLDTPGTVRAAFDRDISRLGKRIFLMNNTHAKGPQIFQTRWVMNYLAGPLTRAQIPALNQLAGSLQQVPAGSPEKETHLPASIPANTAKPPVPQGVLDVILPVQKTMAEACAAQGRALPAREKISYRPALLGQASIRFLDRKWKIDREEQRAVLIAKPDSRGMIRWQEFPVDPIVDVTKPVASPADSDFSPIEMPLSDARLMKSLEKDFQDWLFRESVLVLKVHPALNMAAGPETTPEEFDRLCAEAAKNSRSNKELAAIERKLVALREKLGREQRELEQDQANLTQRTMEEIGTGAENLIGLFTGSKRRLTTSLTKRRLTANAGAEVEESKQAIAAMEKQIAELEQVRDSAATGLVSQKTEVFIRPAKKDVYVEFFGVAWLPSYRMDDGMEIPAR